MNIKRILIIMLIYTLSILAKDKGKYYVNIYEIEDGTYIGRHMASGYDYNVIVRVYSGILSNIKLLNPPNNNVLRKADNSFESMKTVNNIEADAVTGATWKALVYDALTQKTPYDETL